MSDEDDEVGGTLHPLLTGMGERLRQRREELGLSQQTLGEIAGTDAGRISRLERNQRTANLTINVVAGLAHGLRCRFGWLATGELPVEPIPDSVAAGVFIDGAALGAEQARQLRDIASAIELLHNPRAKRRRTNDDKAG